MLLKNCFICTANEEKVEYEHYVNHTLADCPILTNDTERRLSVGRLILLVFNRSNAFAYKIAWNTSSREYVLIICVELIMVVINNKLKTLIKNTRRILTLKVSSGRRLTR